MPKSKRRKPKYSGPTKPQESKVLTKNPVDLAPMSEPAPGIKKDTVMVGFLHPGEVRGEFATALFATGKKIPNIAGLAARQSGPRIAAGRNKIVKEFLLTDLEWLLMVDADMHWNPDDLMEMLKAAHRDIRPIMGGLCFADQNGQLFPTIYKFGEDDKQFHVALEWPRDKVIAVDGTGAAFILINRRVLEKMYEAYKDETPHPWFQDLIVEGHDRGEDLVFCTRARELGYEIYVDTRMHVGHMKHRSLDIEEYDREKAAGRFLITGTGRCGTGWARMAMSKLHVPTGHEEVFNPQTMGEAGAEVPPWKWSRGDASWMGAPFLDRLDAKVVHLVRDPLEVVRSMVGIGWLGFNGVHGAYEEVVRAVFPQKDWFPTEDRDELLKRACFFIRKWNEMIEETGAPRFRLEDISTDADQLSAFSEALTGQRRDRSKIEEVLVQLTADGKVNSRKRDETIVWDDLCDALKQQAERYGYGPA